MPSPNYHTPSNRKYKVFVIHDVEAPLTDNYARVLAGPAWFGKTSAQSSAHYMVGPTSIISMVEEENASWAVGPRANGITTSAEQTGYASYTRAQWMTADGLRQIHNMAVLFVDYAKRRGIPLQRVSSSALQSYGNGGNIAGGWCHHYDITNNIGGTTHTDTGNNWPDDVFQAEVNKIANGGTPKPVGGRTYVVQSGDTLSEIAAKYGVSVAQLVSWNKLSNANSIEVGQKISVGPLVPPKPGAKTLSVKIDGKPTEVYNVKWPKPAYPFAAPGVLGVSGAHTNNNSQAVKVIRRWLATVGIVTPTAAHTESTIYTTGLRDAVKKGQEYINKASGRQRLPVNGIVDKRTWDAFGLRSKMSREELRSPGK